MNSANINRYKEAVKAIGNVSQLSTEQLIETSRQLLRLFRSVIVNWIIGMIELNIDVTNSGIMIIFILLYADVAKR